MGIGRSFQEALHKATQSLEIKRNGLGADGKGQKDYDKIVSKLKNASWDRVFVIYDAIKIGMLSSAEIIETVSDKLDGAGIPIISDPVMVAKSGDRLLRNDALSALKEKLVPLATVLTPNLPEAADLLGQPEASSEEDLLEQAKALLDLGPKNVLMKGGHAKGKICVDFLVSQDGQVEKLEAPRLDTQNTHGTGCTLSASIASGIAKGLSVGDAVVEAHAYLQGAIHAADTLHIGSGHGPVHHFHKVWK